MPMNKLPVKQDSQTTALQSVQLLACNRMKCFGRWQLPSSYAMGSSHAMGHCAATKQRRLRRE